ncbi:BA14K family protein [Bartonella sp. F02]|uniref:BA14K family protein n=1 Tax=Bartonella sp. F02 TaxID=2967262 RepID=UPI0022A925FE|nr:BA14K family protein [Bartonella sp. F02]MCZ2327907.1 BA14K family protein [Bartonella sp. F02]
MRIINNLCYVLAIMFIGNIFVMLTNIAGLAQKDDAEIIPQSSFQEDFAPLVITGRKELNGFKGYHNYRHGYRKYSDNWWYPEAAFLVFENVDVKNISLETVLASPKREKAYSVERKKPWMLKQHIDSCMKRYRSYNINDNSYQPFHGARKQCISRIFKG